MDLDGLIKGYDCKSAIGPGTNTAYNASGSGGLQSRTRTVDSLPNHVRCAKSGSLTSHSPKAVSSRHTSSYGQANILQKIQFSPQCPPRRDFPTRAGLRCGRIANYLRICAEHNSS